MFAEADAVEALVGFRSVRRVPSAYICLVEYSISPKGSVEATNHKHCAGRETDDCLENKGGGNMLPCPS